MSKFYLLLTSVFLLNGLAPQLLFLEAQTIVPSIDTLVFEKHTVFESNLIDIVKSCEINCLKDTLTKKRFQAIRNIFNHEFKTKVFDEIPVVTGLYFKLPLKKDIACLMEWHFNSVAKCDQVAKLLAKSKEGQIRKTIYPYAFSCIKKGKKIYIITYSPKLDDKTSIPKTQECINRSIN